MENIAKKAQSCHLDIDLSPAASSADIEPQPLLEVLSALDQTRNEINRTLIDIDTLKKLPFWNSYQRWENFITIGLLYASDISHIDPVENAEIKKIIDTTTNLYI
jgi:hypothetical protein